MVARRHFLSERRHSEVHVANHIVEEGFFRIEQTEVQSRLGNLGVEREGKISDTVAQWSGSHPDSTAPSSNLYSSLSRWAFFGSGAHRQLGSSNGSARLSG
jgi:hypothetical protein